MADLSQPKSASKCKPAPLQSRVRELLAYDPLSGVLTWTQKRPNAKIGSKAGWRTDLGYVQIGFDGQTQNGIRDDNRWENLRAATRSKNTMHRRQATGSLGVRGVSMDRGRFRARIMKNRKSVDLGHFSTLEEAKAAYEAAQKEMHGEFAYAPKPRLPGPRRNTRTRLAD